jgi:hypothetical protein
MIISEACGKKEVQNLHLKVLMVLVQAIFKQHKGVPCTFNENIFIYLDIASISRTIEIRSYEDDSKVVVANSKSWKDV